MIVGTWNLENLFRWGQADGPSSQEAYDAKLEELRRVIDGLRPDVLAVQEVGNLDALEDLRTRLAGDWHSEVSEHPDPRGIRVGFLSRLELTDVEQVHPFPDRLLPVQVNDDGGMGSSMGRGALRVRVRADGRDVDLLTCHLKSKLLTFPGPRFSPHDEDERARFASYALFRRSAEATTVRVSATSLLGGLGQERAVIVLGDLNDEPTAQTTQILLGPTGSEIGTEGFERPDKGDAARLWNLAGLIPEERRFSRVYRGRGELIDHILVSHQLVHRVQSIDTGPGDAPSITDDPHERRDAPGSDHLPVVARFDLA